MNRDVIIQDILTSVLVNWSTHTQVWRDKHDEYWMMRLMQEVGELASSLAGDHEDSPEHKLEQIAGIAINWLIKREIERQGSSPKNLRPEERVEALMRAIRPFAMEADSMIHLRDDDRIINIPVKRWREALHEYNEANEERFRRIMGV